MRSILIALTLSTLCACSSPLRVDVQPGQAFRATVTTESDRASMRARQVSCVRVHSVEGDVVVVQQTSLEATLVDTQLPAQQLRQLELDWIALAPRRARIGKRREVSTTGGETTGREVSTVLGVADGAPEWPQDTSVGAEWSIARVPPMRYRLTAMTDEWIEIEGTGESNTPGGAQLTRTIKRRVRRADGLSETRDVQMIVRVPGRTDTFTTRVVIELVDDC